MRISSRAQRVQPFYVMEVAKAAAELSQRLRAGATSNIDPLVLLNMGEPDFTAAPLVVQAATQALHDGRTQYTAATGLPALRERISQWYAERLGAQVSADRIIITAGASAALQLACLALIESGDEVLVPDPSYPCNKQFVSAADGVAVSVPTSAAERFQLSAASVQAHWGERTRGVLLASPSNPTGTSVHPDELRRIHEVVSARGGVTMVDEIYLPLSYDAQFGRSALAIDDNIISINSFSKYFNMTGWRLGWLVVPPSLVGAVERLAQNLFICASTVAQHAALACFEPESLALYEARRAEFKARRDFFIPQLQALGLNVPVMPDGAFYAWADVSPTFDKLGVSSSWDWVFKILQDTHIAVAPGRDFGADERMVRFSTAGSMAQLEEALRRLKQRLA
jgi:aspartate/methionine/tyrosine aminotransferase